jgi:DNA-binding MarR family transcriptional regulator
MVNRFDSNGDAHFDLTDDDELEQTQRQILLAQLAYGEHFDVTPLLVVMLLNRLTALLSRLDSYELQRLDLAASEFNALAVLHRCDEPLTMRQLGSAVSVRPNNLTALVRALEARDLVERRPNAVDRRSALIRITARGRSLMDAYMPAHWSLHQEVFGALGLPDRRQLAELLASLLRSISAPGEPLGFAPRIRLAVDQARRSQVADGRTAPPFVRSDR